jgi:hypothetical protein
MDRKPYPRTCMWCNLGPCAYVSERPAAFDTSVPYDSHEWKRCTTPETSAETDEGALATETEYRAREDRVTLRQWAKELETENTRLREVLASSSDALRSAFDEGYASGQWSSGREEAQHRKDRRVGSKA